MSPASYRAAPPRVGTTTVHRRGGRVPGTPGGLRHPPREHRVTTEGWRDGGSGWTRACRSVSVQRLTVAIVSGHEATSAFAGDPQPVEVFHRGVWYSGELLGWRFDDSGRALARVRCVVDGLRHSTWKELTDLRLPERGTRDPAAAPAPAPVAAPVAASKPGAAPVVQWAAIGRHEAAAPSWSADRRPSVPEDDDTR